MTNAKFQTPSETPAVFIRRSKFSTWRSRLLFELAEAHAHLGEDLLQFVEAGRAEVLAAEQLIFRAAGELADGGDVQTLKRLARADGKLDVVDRLAEQLFRNVAGHVRRTLRSDRRA